VIVGTIVSSLLVFLSGIRNNSSQIPIDHIPVDAIALQPRNVHTVDAIHSTVSRNHSHIYAHLDTLPPEVAINAIAICDASVCTSKPRIGLPEQLTELRPSIPVGPLSVSFSQTPFEHHAVGDDGDHIHLLAGLQAGIVMATLNATGGGVQIELHHDWQTVIARYSTSFGLRRTSAELFRNMSHLGLDNTQQIVDVALELGATLHQGDFWATIAGGPNYTKSSFSSVYTPSTGGIPMETSSSLSGPGASAQASFGYRITNYVGLEFTGFVSNHTETYGGLLLSIVAGNF